MTKKNKKYNEREYYEAITTLVLKLEDEVNKLSKHTHWSPCAIEQAIIDKLYHSRLWSFNADFKHRTGRNK